MKIDIEQTKHGYSLAVFKGDAMNKERPMFTTSNNESVQVGALWLVRAAYNFADKIADFCVASGWLSQDQIENALEDDVSIPDQGDKDKP